MRGDLTLFMADEKEGMKTVTLLPDASEEQIKLFCDTLNPLLMATKAFLCGGFRVVSAVKGRSLRKYTEDRGSFISSLNIKVN